MPKWRGRLYATDRARDFDHERDRSVRIGQIYDTIDRQPFQWVVVLVAGIGFFLDGYTIFVSNIALPMIAYVYWKEDNSTLSESSINIATLGGTILGQFFFGIMADKYGRKKMYGMELIIIIGATLGVVMCSTGAHDSMNVFAWLIWWRIVVGIGVGADYPLSAIITSEFAPTPHRARMMASVFFMQPLGQILGNVVSLLVVVGTRNSKNADPVQAVDTMWRWVIGIGVVPGVIALVFRMAIPETPLFLIEIEDNPIKAEFDAAQLFGESLPDSEPEEAADKEIGTLGSITTRGSVHFYEPTSPSTQRSATEEPEPRIVNLNSRWSFSRSDIHQYFWKEGNWRTLLATSLCWLLLDFGFYGIGLNSPQFLAKTWGDLSISGPSPIWMTNSDPNASLYTMFMNTSKQSLVILNCGSFAGGLMLILFANRLNRVHLQKYSFLFLAALFITLGTVFITTQKTGGVAIALYVVGQFAFNFGPNGTTYIIPAEMFPTRYRASCHGISAASGKLGSILVQVFSAYYKFGASSPGKAQTRRYGYILLVFSAAMVLGAVITHFMIPTVQYPDKKSKSLEILATGRAGRKSQTATRSVLHRSPSEF